jgi:glycosyltransferase involved in cell wall biosynthesis
VRKLKIAYITLDDPNDKHAWSGTSYYILQSLRKHAGEVDALGPAEPGFIGLVCKALNYLSIQIFEKRFDYRHSTIYAKACSKFFQKKIGDKKYDLIVAPAGVSSLAYLKTDIPKVYIGDRVIEGALDYHEILSDLWNFSKKQSIKTDKIALQNSTLNIFSSQWAANFAIDKYRIDKKKITVFPFGANMDDVPGAKQVFANKKQNGCKLLLIGTSWQNKGADIAYNALQHLSEIGIDAHLTVCGCTLPAGIKSDKLTVIPFLNKNTADGRRKLEELFLSHSFFILPTRFDCTPIVFCEASAFALPVLSADTGGVEGHIKQGINGYLIDYSDKGKAYAEKIAELFRDKEQYNNLCKSARAFYDEQLNWDVWAKHFLHAIESLIS